MIAKNKPVWVHLFSFILPAVIMLLAFRAMGMAPFGDSSVLIMDMSDQYVEFFCGLKNGDVFYSWSKALGGTYIGVFAYYLSSPLSIITLFFSNTVMPIVLLFLTVLKIGLAGLSLSLLLRYKFKKCPYAIVLFSAFYGLMSYNIAYSMCVMWLDGVIWLPIIILGVERVLEKKGIGLLAAALLASFLSTYYISYMSGLFTALYFVYRCAEMKLGGADFFSALKKFVISVITAAALGAVFLLPTLMTLFEGKLVGASVDYSGVFNFSLSDFIKKLLPGSYDSITNSGTPYIYCGALVLILFAAFFFMRKSFSTRSRLLAGVLSIILFLSMWLCALDKVWHVFQYPNWFPYRYSFVISFFMILTAYRVYAAWNISPRSLSMTALALLCVVDLYANTTGILSGLDKQFGYKSYSEYAEYKENVSELLDAIEADDSFFRVGATFERSKNEPIGFGYKGFTHYSSSYNLAVNKFLSGLGLSQSYFWSSYFGSTMVTDAIFDVKYVLSDREVSPYYTAVSAGAGGNLYYNPYALSVGMAVNGNSLDGFTYGADAFQTQNSLINALTGNSEACFEALSSTASKADGRSEFTVVSDGMPIYVYFKKSVGGELLVNGVLASKLISGDAIRVQYIGIFSAGETVTVTVTGQYNADCTFYRLNMDVFESAVNSLSTELLEISSYGNGRIEGAVSADNGDVLLTTIPFDDGWAVYVNGKKTAASSFAGTLLTIPLTAGKNEILMVYRPPGFTVGLIISLGALCLVAAALLRKRMRKTNLRHIFIGF